jgi:VanZ family protein
MPSASGRCEPGLAAWLPVAAWALVIAVGSSIPAGGLPAGSWWRHDKLIHAAEYAVLAGLLVRGLVRGGRRGVGAAALIAVAVGLLFGATDELHQLATPGRDAAWADLAADGAGALGGALLVAVWYRLARRAGPWPAGGQ